MKKILLVNELTGQLTPVSMLDLKLGDVVKVIGTNTGMYRIGIEHNLKTGGETMKMFFPVDEIGVR